MATAEDILAKIRQISLLYSDKRPVLHIDSLTGQMHMPKADIRPLLDELEGRNLIKFHQSTKDLFMLTDAGKTFTMP